MLDLSVDHVSINPVTDNQVSVGYELHNLGTEKTNRFRTAVYLSQDPLLNFGDKLLNNRRESLAAGESKDIDLLLNFNPNQSNYLIFKADSANKFSEFNEKNNFKAIPITGVDLTIKDGKVELIPDGLTVSYTVSNSGPRRAGSFSNLISLDGQILKKVELKSVGSQKERSFSHSLKRENLTPGTHQISILADGYNQIRESNESNNSFLLDATISDPTQKPDLLITDMWTVDIAPDGSYKVTKTQKPQ
ncbi:hypothetical protein C7H19_09500 [Aphanothece hegewaldii CCALA 016]|uniref:CARDB domain-containing protein n=1 Tax=Aphanothece hegewaldii CCALA 016 TaxID=2107694 RepID=A0A2T1LZG5_9CHRO|nr:CARDB domain-containing protein [Aphanothece hegewaldii]PSF37768.1 hypothetical protein C7H19_09500 [Aphanothece hegewaldii CCALA 016]